jgi:SpoVK/Ycf46/Vps4 family AAA+-type ATPase
MREDAVGKCNGWSMSFVVAFRYQADRAAPKELGLPFISVSAPSIVSGMSGESEKTLRETFDEAKVYSLLPLCDSALTSR